jgi:hypothetical protein
LLQIPSGVPLPVPLQIEQLSRTIKEALHLLGSSALIKSASSAAVVHSIDDLDDAESTTYNSFVADKINLFLHALSALVARTPRLCAVCEATSHSTDNCFELEQYLFSKMPVDVPSGLKASFQPRLRRLMDNLAALKAYQPSPPPSPSLPALAMTRREPRKPPCGKTVRSLQDIDEDNVVELDAIVDDPDVDVAIIHSITLAPTDHVSSTIFESTPLQCHAVTVCKPPYGVHSDMVQCHDDAASMLLSLDVPASTAPANDRNTARAQVDNGSNTTTTNRQDLLWNYAPIRRPKSMQDAGGTRHDAIGIGFLMVPSSNPHGTVPVWAYYTPSIEATILSPSEFCRQQGPAYNTHVVETEHDKHQSTMVLRHRLRRSQDIVVVCISRNGLSFTGPLIPPTPLQHTAPLPTKHLHARMIHAADLSNLHPIFDPDDDAPGHASIGSPPARPGVIARTHRIDDPDDRVLFVNHLNQEALRIL